MAFCKRPQKQLLRFQFIFVYGRPRIGSPTQLDLDSQEVAFAAFCKRPHRFQHEATIVHDTGSVHPREPAIRKQHFCTKLYNSEVKSRSFRIEQDVSLTPHSNGINFQLLLPSHPMPTALPYAAKKLFRAPAMSRSTRSWHFGQTKVLSLSCRLMCQKPQLVHVFDVPGSSVSKTCRPAYRDDAHCRRCRYM